MKATVTTILIAALAVTVLTLSVALVSGRRSRAGFPIPEITMRSDTVLVRDTVLIDRPVEVEKRIIDTILISTVLPVPGDIVRLTDTVYMHLPVEQKHYSAPEYDAWVSGFRPSLDSLKFHTQSARITNTIPLPVHPKPKRWGIGIQVGYGMTTAPRPEFHPYIGLGISYNIFSF